MGPLQDLLAEGSDQKPFSGLGPTASLSSSDDHAAAMICPSGVKQSTSHLPWRLLAWIDSSANSTKYSPSVSSARSSIETRLDPKSFAIGWGEDGGSRFA